MNVYDQAHGLAKAIKASEEYKQYDQAKAKLKENPELEKMIKEVQAKQFELQAKAMMGQETTPEEMVQVQTLYGIILKDPLASQYMETEMRFSVMMKDVYEILGEATGMGDMLG